MSKKQMANRDGNTPVVRNLVSAFTGIVAECFQRTCCERPQYNSRQTEIVVKLNSLLQTDLAVSHSPNSVRAHSAEPGLSPLAIG